MVQEGERTPRYRPPQGALQAVGSRLHAGVRAPMVVMKLGIQRSKLFSGVRGRRAGKCPSDTVLHSA